MNQVLQNLRDGSVAVVDVPSPRPREGELLVRTSASLVSPGTERMLLAFGRASWLDKARRQPDKVRMVLEKARADGVAAAVEAVRSRLDEPLVVGYCNVGVVAEVGAGAEGFRPGDRVVSNGAHAEVVCVSKNLCARIPERVSDEQAAFTVLGAVGLQGIRLAAPTLGESVVVTGLGLIGLLTVQMLRAQGCRVLGLDPDPRRAALARAFGAEVVDLAAGEDPLRAASAFSRGLGIDAVIVTASTESDEPIRQAARMCRRRGRIVLVGVAGLSLSRADFYEKELTFQVSCSYGPGRYDPAYEQAGQDYPIGHVRWTAQRNFEAVLDLMDAGRLEVASLVSWRFPLEQAADAYDLLVSREPSLGILLEYPRTSAPAPGTAAERVVALAPEAPKRATATVGFLGAGNHAGRVLIPAFRAAGATLRTVVSQRGVSAVHRGRRHGFARAATDPAMVLGDEAVDTVVVATRHDSHARYVAEALRAGKHVFCEKPLCLTRAELDDVAREARARPAQALMVGFNRRFAPHVVRIKQLLSTVAGPWTFVVTVNAGAVPPGHWARDRTRGGGRLLGEGCHFIDLMRHLAGAPVTGYRAQAPRGTEGTANADDAIVTLDFADGSVGVLHYLGSGHRGFPKERVEVFGAGRVLQLDNFRRLRAWGWRGFSGLRSWRQDKGAERCARAFVDAVRAGRPAPIPLDEVLEVGAVSIAVAEALA